MYEVYLSCRRGKRWECWEAEVFAPGTPWPCYATLAATREEALADARAWAAARGEALAERSGGAVSPDDEEGE